MLASFDRSYAFLAVLFGADPYQMSYYSICGRIDQFLIGMTIELFMRRVVFPRKYYAACSQFLFFWYLG